MTREEAIRIIETVFQDEYVYKYYDSITHQALDMAIEALSTEVTQDWIPISEKLPKTMGEYLITVLSNPSKNPTTSAAFYSTLKKEFGTFKPSGEWEKWDVIAWMPRPKPYREGDEV